MSTYTSRSRFDEARRFTGVFQQMGRVFLDSDWNEEVRIRLADARRRSSDLAEGSPDEGFLISAAYVLDPIVSPADFTGTGLAPDDERFIRPELALARREPASLPLVLRSHGNVNLLRAFAAPIDLRAVPRPEGGGAYAVATLVVAVRFEVPPNEQEATDARLLLTGPMGQVAVPLALDRLPSAWTPVRIPMSALAALDRVEGGRTTTVITGWGLTGIPPRAQVFVDALRAEVAGMDREDFVIRGGDGTLAGAGRMFVDGVRVFREADHRYLSQPDYPEPPSLSALAGATPPPAGGHFLVYLDLWEQPVTALDDEFLVEPALDGADTTTRLRLVQQVKARWIPAGAPDGLPTAVGGGALTTVFADADPTPLRYPALRHDPARGLHTESLAAQKGYRGHENLHVRVEVFGGPTGRRAALWSRDNAATVLPLVEDAPARATTVYVSPEDALRLRAGDVVVVEDRVTRLQPEGPRRRPALRRVAAVDAGTGAVTLALAESPTRSDGTRDVLDDAALGTAPAGDAGLPFACTTRDRGALRRWDGVDWLVEGQRYNLPDGLDVAFTGDPAAFRPGDFWSFTARVHDPDGRSRGRVEPLLAAPPHGPIHVHTTLARIREIAGARAFEDLRARYLPLAAVRDRLRELEQAQPDKGPFAIVVGDGETTHGDIDQDRQEGVTGDEAIQAALRRLAGRGGTLYLRAGTYTLERPVLLDGVSRVRIVGDGDATVIDAVGAGGAFIVYASGADGEVALEHLDIRERPLVGATIGGTAEAEEAEIPSEVSDIVLPLAPTDLLSAAPGAPLVDRLSHTLRQLAPAQGRTFAAILATHRRLKQLQHEHQGKPLIELPEAKALLQVLAALPHGVITIADSVAVRVTRCRLATDEPTALGAGVLVTGTCERIAVTTNRIAAAAGVVATPLSAYFTDAFLADHPAAALRVAGLRVEDNELDAAGDGVHGVWLADGALSGVHVGHNRVRRFAVGIEIGERAELRGDGPEARLVVEGNRVDGSRVLGILVTGDGVDVAGNEVTNAGDVDLFESSGLFQAAIQVVGQGVRVRDSWIRLPAVRSAPALGVFAGIVVGEALDDGETTSRAIFDVDVSDNRIEGAGAASPAAGVLIGGPHPVFDVRVRANVIRSVGDAAVRILGTGVAAGRIRVEGNRVEEVALAAPASADPRLADEVEALAPGLPAALGDGAFKGPAALLSALLARADQAHVTERAALDGALRWIERLTLRGAIVASGAEDTQIVDNRLIGAGSFDAPNLPPELAAMVRTAGVAVVGGSDVLVADNHIADVRAPVRASELPGGDGEADSALGPALDALDRLGGHTSAGAGRDAEMHPAATALYELLLAAAAQPAEFEVKHAARLRAALDAIDAGLLALGEAGFAQGFAAQVARLSARPTVAQLPAVLAALRLYTAHLARLTAASPAAEAAWGAVERLEEALLRGDDASLAGAVADARPTLEGLPAAQKAAATAALDAATSDPRGALTQLSAAALLRDEADRASDVQAGEVVGQRVDLIASLAKKLAAVSLAAGEHGQLDPLRADAHALIDLLRDAGADLARHLSVDWTALDQPALAQDRIATFKETAGRVAKWAEGAPADPDADTRAALRLARARAGASLRLLVIDDLEQRVAQLDELADISTALVDTALDSVVAGAGDLAAFAQDSARTATLAAAVTQKLTAAREAAGDDRSARLDEARAALGDLRDAVSELAAAATDAATTAPASELSERRLAGLGALVLALAEVGPGQDPGRQKATTLLSTLLPRAAREASPSLARAALESVEAAQASILDDDPSPVRVAQALFDLAGLLDAVATTLAGADDSPPMLAAASLLRAVELALDPRGTDAARADAVQTFVASRKSTVSPAIVERLVAIDGGDRAARLARVRDALRDALVRLAVGEAAARPVRVAPAISTAPAPADGVFAATVADQLRIADNTVETALLGVTVADARGHVLADPDGDADALIEVVGNQLRGCAHGALDIAPGAAAVVTVASNQVSACADLAHAAARGQAVARLVGRGALVVHGNVFHGNGHGHPAALLHEVLADWRGDLVLRANTIRHTGGGAGGAGLLLVVEDLDRAVDIVKLSTMPALAVEPPPASKPKPGLRTPWRGAVLTRPVVAPVPPAAAHYMQRKVQKPKLGVADLLTRRPPLRLPLPPLAPPDTPARRSLQIEGNHVQAAGPALLVLATGNDVVSTSVTGNTLQSHGTTGAVYLRRTDATVFSGNHCECPGAVNVVVMRFDAAPVTVSGNVIAGEQPVAQRDPRVLARRDDLKRLAGFEIAKQAGVLPTLIAAGVATTTPAPSGGSSGRPGLSVREPRTPLLIPRQPAIDFSPILPPRPDIVIRGGGAIDPAPFIREAVSPRLEAMVTRRIPRPTESRVGVDVPRLRDAVEQPRSRDLGDAEGTDDAPAPLVISASLVGLLNPIRVAQRPQPRASSLVILGGTRVVSVGNATTAGMFADGADDPTTDES